MALWLAESWESRRNVQVLVSISFHKVTRVQPWRFHPDKHKFIITNPNPLPKPQNNLPESHCFHPLFTSRWKCTLWNSVHTLRLQKLKSITLKTEVAEEDLCLSQNVYMKDFQWWTYNYYVQTKWWKKFSVFDYDAPTYWQC